jgi:hypothetical protein
VVSILCGFFATCLADDPEGIDWDNAFWKYVAPGQGAVSLQIDYFFDNKKIDSDTYELTYSGPQRIQNPDGTTSCQGQGMPGRSGRRIENGIKKITVQKEGLLVDLDSSFATIRIAGSFLLPWSSGQLTLKSGDFHISLSGQKIQK